jgi:hypothetical protein
MFSDTHFHFKMMTEERGVDGVEVLTHLARRDCFFGLDIGTRAGDLEGAKRASETGAWWCIISIILGILSMPLMSMFQAMSMS